MREMAVGALRQRSKCSADVGDVQRTIMDVRIGIVPVAPRSTDGETAISPQLLGRPADVQPTPENRHLLRCEARAHLDD